MLHNMYIMLYNACHAIYYTNIHTSYYIYFAPDTENNSVKVRLISN